MIMATMSPERKCSCWLQSRSLRLEKEVRDWVDSSILEVVALYEQHTDGNPVDSRAKHQLTNAASDTTREWSSDQCIGS